MSLKKNTVVTITGPTCSGKTTLARWLADNGIPEVRSFTTRKPRQGEVDGVQYDFWTREKVESIPKEQLIELVEFKGNYYGNTIGQLQEAFDSSDGVVTVVVEPNGVRHWAEAAKKFRFNHYSVYLETKLRVLVERFVNERLLTCKEEQIPYEAQRLLGLINVEYPTWPNEFDYELTLKNLGVNESATEFSRAALLGFLSSFFVR